MRADATRNRARILDAARTALEAGRTPPMSALAQEAGVGQGTLYRNFPTWAELVMAVHRNDVDDLVASAPRLLEHHPPTDALRLWLQELARYGRIKHGLGEALHADLADEGRAPIVRAIQLILTAGAEDGSLRSDLDGDDVLLLVGFLWRLDPAEGDVARADRLLGAILAGLRHDASFERGTERTASRLPDR